MNRRPDTLQTNLLDGEDLPVYRMRRLPVGDLEGRFLVPRPLIDATRDVLVSFALAGIRDGGHEGLVYWAGRELEETRVFLSVVVPNANHWAYRVMVSKYEVGRAARAARSKQLGILCQVHSHPGSDARHSDGDDDLVLLPFEGMLSIVAPRFGMDVCEIEDFTFHQYQRGQWVLCSPTSVAANVITVSAVMDLR